MAATSLQDQVQTLLAKSLVAPSISPSQRQAYEANQLFQAIAMNLLLWPKTALLIEQKANNALLAALAQELEDLAIVQQDIADMSNPTYDIGGVENLQAASDALTQVGNQTSSSDAFAAYSAAVTNFLQQLEPNLKVSTNQTALSRPAEEAQQDLPGDYAALQADHTAMVSLLHSLAVGVANFAATPMSTLLGASTLQLAQTDIQNMISELSASSSGASARDLANRLIAARASLRTILQAPAVSGPVLSSALQLPAGYSLIGTSDPAPATVSSPAASAFTLGSGATAQVQVGDTTLGPNLFPQGAHFDLADKACIVSAEVSWPVTIPSGAQLYLLDGADYVSISLTAGSRSAAQVVADINAVLLGYASEFSVVGSGRIIIHTPNPTLALLASYTGSSPTYTVSNSTAYQLLGFTIGAQGTAGATPRQLLVDAFNLQFGSLLTATAPSAGGVTLTTLATAPGTSLIAALPSALSMTGTFPAESASFQLSGTVAGIGDVDPVDPRPLIDVGDLVTTPTGSGSIAALSLTDVTLATAVPTFAGDVTVESALDAPHQALQVAVAASLLSISTSQFSSGLGALDAAVAKLSGSPQGFQGQAQALCSALETLLMSLVTVLSGEEIALPANCASDERGILSGIVASLNEKQFDATLDLLLSCSILQALLTPPESASYGGAMASALAAVGQADLTYPNPSQDDTTGLLAGLARPTGVPL
jgi:hypothetical protein